PDVDPVEVIAPDDLLRDGLELVGQGDDVVAVPAHPSADVEQDLVQPGQDGGDLVGDDLRRVEVAGVHAEQGLPGEGVPEVELVRADDVRLRADPEQLALDRVAVQGRVDRLGEDG